MAEQQLVDYIKKAREAGQSDDQTRALLYKNGWQESEVSEAFTSLNQPQAQAQPQQQTSPQPQYQPQPTVQPASQPESQTQPQPQVTGQPQINIRSQPQSQYQPQSSSIVGYQQDNLSQIKTNSHILLKILTALITVIVLGSIAYFAFGQYFNLPYSDIVWNFFRPKPEVVINNMMTNMKNVKSSHTIMQLTIAATDKNTKAFYGTLSLNTNSEVDTIDAKNPKADGNFTVSLTMPGNNSPINATISIAYVGGAFYFKVNNITIPDNYLSALSSASPPIDTSQIKGKWFKVDQDSINALNTLAQTNQNTPLMSSTSPVGLNFSQISQSPMANSLNPNAFQTIQNLIATENIFTVDKQLNDEVISGQKTYHYSVIIPNTKLKDLLTKLVNIQAQGSSSSASSSSQPANNFSIPPSAMDSLVNLLASTIGDINMEIWVGQKDYMLYQIKFDKLVDLSKVSPGLNTQVDVKLSQTNSNFNKPITVQPPAGAQKIEDAVSAFIQASQVQTPQAKVEASLKQIRSDAQSLFMTDNNYSSLCNHGLLNGYQSVYGQELIGLNNDIIAQGARKPACFANAQNFCISAQLADGSYVCIDKNNTVGKTKCTSAKTACK